MNYPISKDLSSEITTAMYQPDSEFCWVEKPQFAPKNAVTRINTHVIGRRVEMWASKHQIGAIITTVLMLDGSYMFQMAHGPCGGSTWFSMNPVPVFHASREGLDAPVYYDHEPTEISILFHKAGYTLRRVEAWEE